MQMKNVCRSYAAHKRGVFSSIVCRIFCEYICLTLFLLLKQGEHWRLRSLLPALYPLPSTLYPLPLSHTLCPLYPSPSALYPAPSSSAWACPRLLLKSNICPLPLCFLPSVPGSCPLHPMPIRCPCSTSCPLYSNRQPCRASR